MYNTHETFSGGVKKYKPAERSSKGTESESSISGQQKEVIIQSEKEFRGGNYLISFRSASLQLGVLCPRAFVFVCVCQ